MARILVVDDNPTDRALLSAILVHFGHELIEAVDGAEGVERARADRPDLVISDVLMPTMDGYEFARALRADAATARVPLIFYTASFAGPRIAELARACGAVGVLAKPSEPQDVVRIVDRAIGSTSPPPKPVPPEQFDKQHLRMITDRLLVKVRELEEANAELARLQAELREANVFLEHIISSGPAVVTSGSVPELVVTYVSPNVTAMLGYRPDEIVDVPRFFGERIHPDDLDRTVVWVDAPAGVPTSVETRLRHADGTYRWVHAVMRLERDDLGNATTFVGHFTDITDRVLAQERHDELERMLRQSQRLESLGQLAGGIAHDFNNLLAVILNYADFVAEEIVEGSAQEDVAQIKRAAKRAADLTHQLLVFGRAGLSEPQTLDLNLLVPDVAAMLGRTLGEHVQLRVATAHEPCMVRADPSRLEQVLVNLAVNSRDAMPDGGVLAIETDHVDVDEDFATARVDLAPGRYVRLTVTDQGQGMTPDVAARAFDPFFSTKPTGKGTGLGLATVYGAVTQAGGHVALYSEPAHGTVVRIYLPSAGDEVPRQATVLIAEDEEAVRQIAVRVLRAEGLEVLDARDALEAVELARTHPGPIDLLVSDVVMPQMSGPDLAAQTTLLRPAVRVLFMSGYPESILRDAGGVPVAVVRKPFTRDALVRAVREALQGREPPA